MDQSIVALCFQVAKKKPVVEERRLTQDEMLAEAAQTGKGPETEKQLERLKCALIPLLVQICSPADLCRKKAAFRGGFHSNYRTAQSL